jgi:hypothetical protein
MQKIFKPSGFDKPSLNHVDVDREESVIRMRHVVHRINKEILKKGAKYSCKDSFFKYVRNKSDDGQED